jgi:hypothetical protein
MMWKRPVTVGRSADPVVTTVDAITVSPSYAVSRCDVRLMTIEWVCTTAAFEAEAGSGEALGDEVAADDLRPEGGLWVGLGDGALATRLPHAINSTAALTRTAARLA